MALSEIFFLAIVFYLLYRFVFNFIVPVARTTRHVRQQFRNMQDQTEQEAQPRESRRPAQKPSVGEYIDFEEVKD
ncbi:MAG TPA: hypothetical protein VHE34_19075 [Puia sp.]|uniref:hypothetical protein n=1 Tax=Puia sp. TaxID=2045100 RepID=UPI002C84DB7D|nr:hypothetical protein [Puia sp.]HVU97343.1 hypothetical protein [Puia sp.]